MPDRHASHATPTPAGDNIMSTPLDVNIARISHLRWELELEAVALGANKTLHMPKHQDCELGIWLHSRGQQQIENRSLLEGLLSWHKQFHQTAELIMLHGPSTQSPPLPKGKMDELLAQLRSSSRHIVTLLTQAELEFYGDELKIPSTSQPLAKFVTRLFQGPHTAASETIGILEIGHARLVHLQWANHLPDTFRNRGRHVSLEPAELCALGVWIHGTGLKRFGQINELVLCDQAHTAFHTRAAETLRNLRKHRDEHADRAYAEVLNLSKEIIYLLSVIEYRLLGDAAISRFSSIIS
ncbi:MAG: CZB domain-containing protein [Nitrospirae bacterium]|nr:CZB domain-containing protein [Magnetococcales bacterium]